MDTINSGKSFQNIYNGTTLILEKDSSNIQMKKIKQALQKKKKIVKEKEKKVEEKENDGKSERFTELYFFGYLLIDFLSLYIGGCKSKLKRLELK